MSLLRSTSRHSTVMRVQMWIVPNIQVCRFQSLSELAPVNAKFRYQFLPFPTFLLIASSMGVLDVLAIIRWPCRENTLEITRFIYLSLLNPPKVLDLMKLVSKYWVCFVGDSPGKPWLQLVTKSTNPIAIPGVSELNQYPASSVDRLFHNFVLILLVHTRLTKSRHGEANRN